MKKKPIIISDPPKHWWPGDKRAEEFMPPVAEAIKHHMRYPGDKFTDIYNRAYEAVCNAIKKYAIEEGG